MALPSRTARDYWDGRSWVRILPMTTRITATIPQGYVRKVALGH